MSVQSTFQGGWGGPDNVVAIPPVARMPQRITVGEDIEMKKLVKFKMAIG
jgi:hypothetical protein